MTDQMAMKRVLLVAALAAALTSPSGAAAMTGNELPLRPVFDHRIKLDFHGARITSDGGLLAYRELDHAAVSAPPRGSRQPTFRPFRPCLACWN